MRVHIEFGMVPMNDTAHPNRYKMAYHCYASNGDNATVRDSNYCLEVIGMICKEGSPFLAKKPDEEGYKPLFDVFIDITNTRKIFGGMSNYVIDYKAVDPHCPLCVREDAMEVYNYIKGVIAKTAREIKKLQKEKRDAVRARVKQEDKQRKQEECGNAQQAQDSKSVGTSKQ